VAHLLSDLTVAALAFGSTNIDDLLLLVALFSSGMASMRAVIIGQYVALSLVLLCSLILRLTIGHIPTRYEALLGIIPLAIGIRGWWTLSFASPAAPTAQAQRPTNGSPAVALQDNSKRLGALDVTGLTLAVSADNLAAYTPLFGTAPGSVATYVTVFGILTAVWCVLGYGLVNSPLLAERLRHVGRFMLPLVMTVIGLMVLVRPYVTALVSPSLTQAKPYTSIRANRQAPSPTTIAVSTLSTRASVMMPKCACAISALRSPSTP
jgi:cadmium resistance protein CadD (predicted permease)